MVYTTSSRVPSHPSPAPDRLAVAAATTSILSVITTAAIASTNTTTTIATATAAATTAATTTVATTNHPPAPTAALAALLALAATLQQSWRPAMLPTTFLIAFPTVNPTALCTTRRAALPAFRTPRPTTLPATFRTGVLSTCPNATQPPLRRSPYCSYLTL